MVIRIRKSKKDRQHNGQRKKDTQRATEHTYKAKDRVYVTLTPLKSGVNSGRECRFCSFFLLFQFKVHSWFPFAKVVSLIERTSSIYLELNVNTKYITLSEQFRNSIKKIVGRDQINTPS